MARRARPFWSLVNKADGCWEWLAGKSGGYGVYGGKKAHRVAWELAFGPIPNGLWVLHRCDNPGCVKPDHLFLGTCDDNNKDRARKGRTKGAFDGSATHPAKIRGGERHWRAKLSAEDVRAIRRLHLSGQTHQSTAEQFGVNPATISRIARGEWRQEVT